MCISFKIFGLLINFSIYHQKPLSRKAYGILRQNGFLSNDGQVDIQKVRKSAQLFFNGRKDYPSQFRNCGYKTAKEIMHYAGLEKGA